MLNTYLSGLNRYLAQASKSRRRRPEPVASVHLLAERLEARQMLAADFGDAPEFYPTTLAEDGARHETTTITLGATRTDEVDGTHSPDASADSGDDGVVFGSMQVGATQQTVVVSVTGGSGKLDAWIDFNGDGSWGGAGEQIFDSVDVVAGANALTFDVPSWATSGTTYARFRLSTAGNLGWTGEAADGEVEDYQVTITSPTPNSGLFGGQNVITNNASGAYSVMAADIDGDGHIDVLNASALNNKVAWYKNDGSGNFGPEQIISDSVSGATTGLAADVDGDGDLDVLASSFFGNRIDWFENDGNGNFGAAQDIATGFNSPRTVSAADVDGDGDLDVIAAAQSQNEIAWWANDGSGNFGPKQTISTAVNQPLSVFAADLDGDGHVDILSASYGDDKIAWYKNNGNGTFGGQQVISTEADGPWNVIAADVDGDGHLDVLSAARQGDEIAWYRNNGDGTFGTKQVISSDSDSARSVFAADVDGDGDLDVLSASAYDDKIAWYINDGSGNFGPQRIISTADDGASSIFAADLDNDGDLDVLAAAFIGNSIAWYENQAVGFTLSKTTATTTEAGGTDSFTVVLDNQPLSDVVLTISVADPTEGTVDVTQLTFTTANWDTPQTVTITGVDDSDADDDQTYLITVAVNSAASDDVFDALPAQTVTVTNTNDDLPPSVPVVIAGPGTGEDTVRILDAVTGELRGTLSPFPGFTGGVNVAMADLDGDGIDEIITAAGAGGGPHVRIFNGATLEQIDGPLGSFFAYEAAFTGGVFVAAGDVNDDGHVDIITGAGAGGGPHVRVFSGLDGSVLMSFFAYDAAFTGGVSVAAGDINGDDHADIITGAGPGGGPHVRVFSGDGGSELRSFFAYEAAFAGGVSVASGDVNNDTYADIITGAGPGGGPHVRAFSGFDGSVLASFFAYDPDFTGGVSVSSLDLNGDDRDDFVTGAGPGGGPHVRVLDAQTQDDLTINEGYYSVDANYRLGAIVAAGRGLPPEISATAWADSVDRFFGDDT
jgi:hypothetical protein